MEEEEEEEEQWEEKVEEEAEDEAELIFKHKLVSEYINYWTINK